MAGPLEGLVTLVVGGAADLLEQVLGEHGHPGQGAAQGARRLLPGLVVKRNDQAVEGRVHRLGTGDGQLQQFGGGDFPVRHQFGQRHAVEIAVFVKTHDGILII